MFCIIAAAGDGNRFGEKKQFLKIGKKYILELSVEKFIALKIDKIIVAVQKEDVKIAEKILAKFRENIIFVEGKKTRQETVKAAFLSHYKNHAKDDIVLIHDAARPFFRKKYVAKLIETAKITKAAILATPIVDTVKYIKNSQIEKTIKRENLLLSQTPQAFSIELYKKAIENAETENIICTDDCELVEQIGVKISFILSSRTNFKITTEKDLDLAKYLMNLEEVQNV